MVHIADPPTERNWQQVTDDIFVRLIAAVHGGEPVNNVLAEVQEEAGADLNQ
jgi:hypothetical protein